MIIQAEFTAGRTIDEAILEALQFARKNNVGVRASINGIVMTFFAIPGNTDEELVKIYHDEYERKYSEAHKSA